MIQHDPQPQCPLCDGLYCELFFEDHRRDYLRCRHCQVVFVPSRYFLSRSDEKACYDLHQNNPSDERYRKFLSRLADPLIARLPRGSRGLDFGSGPGPTLSVMLSEAGFPTDIYDPFYAPIDGVWRCKYDFVMASEVVEHLHRPMQNLQRVWNVLRPGGWFALMTKRLDDVTSFGDWHYKNDPTHVIFYSQKSLQWLASQWQAELILIGSDVALFQKHRTP
ncbi:MAG: class I SAM-dependent methyltransferase [Planctomycetaceae bacterium]